MRAAVFDGYGDAGVLAVRVVPSPRPGRGQVHVRVRAAALNPKDVLVRKGKFPIFTGLRFPQGVGFDFSGEILGGARFAPGTRAYGMVNGWRGRTCAEELICPVDECEAMPSTASFEEAAAIPLAGQTALQALRDLGRVEAGTRVCINGASGGVGTFAIQIAKILGARVTTLSSARNLDLCLGLGSDEALDYRRDDPFGRPAGFDVIFDVFGNRTWRALRPALSPRGVFISTVPSWPIAFDGARTALGWGQRARLVRVRSRAADLSLLRRWVEAATLRAVVDRVYELSEIGEAERYLETKRARGKVVVRVG